ncbi:MAG: glycosyltransferase family 4 protein [Actinomycetota bacterium]|jgi:glycosyltransferase involved in cell wall biosynthesis
MKVLHVTATDAPRGAERRALDLADALQRLGIPSEIRAVCASGRPDALPIQALRGGRFHPGGLLELRRFLARADVAIAYGSSALPATALASIGSTTPFVYRSIGDPLYWSNTRARRWRTAAWLRRAAAVTVLWSGPASTYAEHFGVPPAKVSVLPSGVDTRRFPAATPESRSAARRALGLSDDGHVLACVGSLSPEKRVDRAIDVVTQLDDVILLVAGDGPERRQLTARADALVPGRVRFLGNVDEPSQVYAAADALLLTSDTEGLPGVVIEAALCGRPAIATRVGGVSDAVVDGRTGATAPRDDIPGLIRAARVVLNDSVALGAAAREHCLARYDVEVIVGRWAALLSRVVAGPA